MIDRALDQISLDDITALVTFGRSESRTLDFKRSFPGSDHKGVRDVARSRTQLH
ncbi:hypothetical protein OVA07_01010 [Novosphingobium sp. SL115]|uniref:hypothetical protein n=1 Tax=Novosphingobium sp. SL115 TaxID=2995150 RepID=UPI002272C5AE|nr:hypothetical protein [Novosphingobium sp. SL115]MCY1669591.1 hypothetical protein [Novosphingobium sp. SL115]